MIKDFNAWIEYEGASEGSGRSEKIWLVNPENKEIGLFKFPKTQNTTEHYSEKIASEIAKLIGIECMKVDIGNYGSRLGCLSYRINKNGEDLIEGIRLINKYYPAYNQDTLYDEERDEYYCIEMILSSIEEYDFQKQILEVMVFDFLIGNTDRHQNNWAILQNGEMIKFCPLYDNGSSLCCYIEEEKLDGFLGNDKVRFQSQVDSKSTSRIRIDGSKKKEPTHLEVLRYLKRNYYEDIIDIVNKMINNVNKENIDLILDKYKGFISNKRIKLIKKFLLGKLELLEREFNL